MGLIVLGLFLRGMISTLPLKLVQLRTEQQFGIDIVVTITRECFGEAIGQLIMRGDIRQMDNIGDNLLPNEVTVDLNMLSPFMKDGILGNANGASIVRIKRS